MKLNPYYLTGVITLAALISFGESSQKGERKYHRTRRQAKKRGKSELVEHVRQSVNTTIYTKTKKSNKSHGKGKGKGKGYSTLEPTPSPTVSTHPSSMPSVSSEPSSILPTISSPPSISMKPSQYICHSNSGRNTDIVHVLDSISKKIAPGSPQEEAATWLKFVDKSDNCNHELRERYILAILFYSTNGDNWKDKSKWLSNDDHCSWFGVTCNHNNVQRLTLSENGLQGTIPSELAFLSSLDYIVFDTNKLHGRVPAEIFGLHDLHRFDVEHNQLIGQFFQPEFFQCNETLKMLQIRDNLFSGTLPSEINSLTKLEDFRFDKNYFTGTLPDMNQMTDLIYFKGSNNLLNGTIPNFSSSEMTRLKVIDLTDNELTGKIPYSLGNMNKLERLYLGGMYLSGTIPYSFWKLSNLIDFFAYDNQLSGEIPESIGGLTHLESLFLSYNNLKGNIPRFKSHKLDYLNLKKNSLSGTIPASLFDIESLRLLYLSSNQLTGTIPEDFHTANTLKDLFLDDNKLTGLIPEITATALPAITEIVLDSNHLAGSIPDGYCELHDILDQYLAIHADCSKVDSGDAQNDCSCCAECHTGKGAILDRTPYNV